MKKLKDFLFAPYIFAWQNLAYLAESFADAPEGTTDANHYTSTEVRNYTLLVLKLVALFGLGFGIVYSSFIRGYVYRWYFACVSIDKVTWSLLGIFLGVLLFNHLVAYLLLKMAMRVRREAVTNAGSVSPKRFKRGFSYHVIETLQFVPIVGQAAMIATFVGYILRLL